MPRKKVRDPVNVQRGARLRSLREKLDLTQEQMAAECGVSHGTYNNWETGYGRISIDGLERIREKWGLPTDYVLFGDYPLDPRRRQAG